MITARITASFKWLATVQQSAFWFDTSDIQVYIWLPILNLLHAVILENVTTAQRVKNKIPAYKKP